MPLATSRLDPLELVDAEGDSPPYGAAEFVSAVERMLAAK